MTIEDLARRYAQEAFPAEKHPDLLNRNVGYYHAKVAQLRRDTETLRILKAIPPEHQTKAVLDHIMVLEKDFHPPVTVSA